jgi:tape measure domain-containing protein
MSTYQLEIDGSGAEAGADRIVKSFDAIKAAADRMEGGVSAAAKKASSSFASMQQNARPVSEAAINSIKSLSDAFRNFRAPSDAAVRNAIIFLQGLKSVGSLNLGRVTGLAGLLAAISGYRGPSATAGKNTLSVLNALRFASSYSSPRGLAGTLAALSAFRGPTAAAGRNVMSLLAALNSFKAGPGMAATVRALEKITLAANAARGSLNSLKGSAPSSINIRANTKQAEQGFMSLAKTNGLLQTALYRTQTAWNALGGILAGRVVVNAINDIIQIKAQLEAATGSAKEAAYQFDFLIGFANKLGLEIVSTAKSYGFFLGSIKGTSMTMAEAKDVFTGFSTAARALQLSTADVDGVFRALGQMMSKGKIQAEELRGQLGDRLPGAFTRFAVALKMVKPGELDQALKKGAVSGEKMKRAIIDVANSLQVEFAGSAEKMSNTIEGAFNRLRNSFTMAASGLGSSGLNDGIIKITDSLRKLLESKALGTAMSALGSAFKFLGDNINLVGAIILGSAITSTIKWLSTLTLAQGAVGALTAVMKPSMTTMEAMAAGLGSIGTQGTSVIGVFKSLWALLLANPWIAVAAAITAAIVILSQFNDKIEEANDLVRQSANASNIAADAETVMEQKLAATNGTLTIQAQKLREVISLKLQANMATLSSGVDVRPSGWTMGGHTLFSAPASDYNKINFEGGRVTVGGTIIKDPTTARALRNVLTPTGELQAPQNSNQAAIMYKNLGVLEMIQKAEGDNSPLKEITGKMSAYLDNAAQLGRLGTNRFSDFAKNVDRNATILHSQRTPGIMGGAPAQTGKKKKHGKTAAEKAQDDINAAIDQAMNGITDLETRAKSVSESISALLSGSFDKAGAAAHNAAVDQEKSFEDAIKGPENKIKGVLQLAHQLGLDVSGKTVAEQYQSAKEAVIGYMEQRQKASAEAKADQKVATDIVGLRADNEAQKGYIDLLNVKGTTMAAANRQLEIQNMLEGTSLENRPKLRAELEKELALRDQLKRSLEATNAQRDFENQQALDRALSPMYKSGMKSEDIDYYKEMLQYRQELIDNDWTGDELRKQVNLKAATLNEARAMKQLTDQYEKANQTAADMADAIVGGFRDGIDAGNNFLDIFKNIFKQLSKIILDFVLYNPMKQWLQQSLSQVLAPQATAGFGGIGTPGTGTTNSYASGQGLIGSVVNSVMGNVLNGGGLSPPGTVAGGRLRYDQNGDLVANSAGAGSTVGDAIIVTGSRLGGSRVDTNAPIPAAGGSRQLSMFTNITNTLSAAKDGMKAFGNFLKTGKGASAGISGAIGAAGTAFAAYQIGSQIGKSVTKALGIKGRAGNVVSGAMGGAAAGFVLGGPVGAAVGAVIGGVIGLFKKVPKLPSSFGNVRVDNTGTARVGATGTYGPADAAIGKSAASSGASLFNQFALQYGAQLKPGNFGTFGQATWKIPGPNNNDQYFYSLTGNMSKGKPTGVMGRDWFRSTDQSEVQAWALIHQANRGMITGLTDTLKTIFKNTKASNMDQLQSDLQIGQAYDEFVKGSFALPDVLTKIRDLNEAFYKLKQQAASLGLSEDKLSKARGRLMDQMKSDFNYQINQGILGYTNPAQAAYNDLVKEYHDAVQTAMAVGGDLNAVEDYYGRKRADLAKKWADTATNGLVSAAKDLYDQLTASSSSPLNATTILGNSRDLYSGLIGQFNVGDFSNVDKLSTYAQNYLDAARTMYGSSTDYFDIFKQVTDQLALYESPGGSGIPGGVGTAPDLPSLDDMVQEINQQSLEMIDAMGIVGQAVVEGSVNIVDAINNLAIALGQKIPVTTPTGPTSGGTGVGSTGGTGGTSSVYGSSGPSTSLVDRNNVKML